MVQNPPATSIWGNRLIQALGTDIAPQDLTQIQAGTQIISIAPGTSFWQSSTSEPGLYVVLAGKVRLFDLHGNRIATLG
ncbi:hypothetical protein [Chamaesiphon minutus]|uniref:Cyclic nucleotide-binding domain-containing protein n=1 Tax=Chamaesiphon minutus (strain ATCC 27169 / PCC 6605) TaxID=1173020 RepID=K9UB04_CHAP6|nr:hypothetical protein [Chamaesiphon minutus]AFY91793.1 hypothetical protein Cha6605_0504 [Chamaesiphon minutus PCC 6605]